MHGYVRATGDLDIWVKISQENIVVQFGYPPFRIDILTSPESLEFDLCYSKKIEQKTEDNIVFNFIDKESLLQNKRAVGRSKDLNDIENLE